MVCMDQDCATFPAGTQTPIGEGGQRLSGGQQARIALARTLFHPRPLLILDDPFAAVDMATERTIFDNLRRLGSDRIILLLSHRLSLFPSWTRSSGSTETGQPSSAPTKGSTPHARPTGTSTICSTPREVLSMSNVIWQTLRQNGWLLVVLILAIAVSIAVSVTPPLILQYIVDSLVSGSFSPIPC